MDSQLRMEKNLIVIDEDYVESDELEIISPPSFYRPSALPSKPLATNLEPYAKSCLFSYTKDGIEEIKPTPKLPAVNLPAPLKIVIHNNIELKQGLDVELEGDEFMRIKTIIPKTEKSKTFIQGWIFRRNKDMNGTLERKQNEVCWILHVNEDDTRDSSIQGLESVAISKILRPRRLLMTNMPFPNFSDLAENENCQTEKMEKFGVLVCRYKFVCKYENAKAREKNKWCERAFIRIGSAESDESCEANEIELRQAWRGETVKGGACKKFLEGETEFIQEEHQCRGIDGDFAMRTRRKNFRRSPSVSLNSMKRGSVATLIRGMELLQKPDNLVDDDLKEIDFQAFKAKNEGRSSNPQNQMLYSAKEGIHGHNEVTLNRTQDSLRSPLQRLANHVFIDLTDEGQDRTPHSSLASKKKRLTKERVHGFAPRTSRERSLEIIEIHAQIDTTSKLGTYRREYESRMTSSYISKPPTFTERKRSISQVQSIPAEVNKRIRSGFANVDTSVTPSIQKLVPHQNGIQQQRYTFGDCFCGAGGTSRGAVGAGLRVEWGFDFSLPACKSYGLNFYRTKVYHLRADQFINLTDRDYKVDFLHLSPPCQPYSGAHTTEGKDDEMNTATLFAIPGLLQIAKPRVVTLEQTSGIVGQQKNKWYFNAVIQMFTAQGFSIRWRVINLTDYGLPQNRQRVIIIASCPGETLPTHPKPTHSPIPRAGLKLCPTINEAIADIPPGWANHDVLTATRKRPEAPHDGNTQARCMTTSGAGLTHPNGQRNFTHREFACLQGFPLEHKFGGKEVKRQIGNAVPPIVATALLTEIKLALMKADGLL